MVDERGACVAGGGSDGAGAAAIEDAEARGLRRGRRARAPVDGFPGLSAVGRIATKRVGFQIRWRNRFPYD